MSINFKEMKLGVIRLEGFVKRMEANLDNFKLCVITIGQCGGKIGQECARLNIPMIALNTAESDLADLKLIDKEKKILMPGFGGASKDIARGKKAVEANAPIVAKALMSKEVIEADFVWVCAGLGGGTGNGGLPTILRALYKIRHKKMYKKGKPTFGCVLSIPGDWEARGLKENAAAGLGVLNTEFIKKGLVGSVLLIENEKLSTDFYKSKYKSMYKEWEIYGNTTVASMLFELAVQASLPANRSVDVAEILDTWSTPGYYAIGKNYISKEVKNDEDIKKVVTESFKDNGVFATGYNFERDALIGGAIIVRPHNKIITNEKFKKVEEEVNSFLKNSKITHNGLIDNNMWTTIDGKSEEKAVIYTQAVCATLPKKVEELVQMINEARAEAKKAKEEREKENSGSQLDNFLNMYQEEQEEEEEIDVDNMDAFALFGLDSVEETQEDGSKEEINDDIDEENLTEWLSDLGKE